MRARSHLRGRAQHRSRAYVAPTMWGVHPACRDGNGVITLSPTHHEHHGRTPCRAWPRPCAAPVQARSQARFTIHAHSRGWSPRHHPIGFASDLSGSSRALGPARQPHRQSGPNRDNELVSPVMPAIAARNTMPTPTSSPSRRRLPLLPSLLAWVTCALLLARAGHMTLVSHTVCALHGQLTHRVRAKSTPPHHHRASSRARPTKRVASSHSDASRGSGAVDNNHHHCHATANDEGQCTLAPMPPSASLTWWWLAGPVDASPAHSAARRYTFAPKTSPPNTRC